MSRRPWPIVLTLANAVLAIGFLAATRAGVMPLGVRGEWEWLRLPQQVGVLPLDTFLGAVGVAAYAAFAAFGMGSLSRRTTPAREAVWLVSLATAAVAIQGWVQSSAPPGYGLAKWVVALHQKGASGYVSLAGTAARDLPKFLAEYPEWVRGQDSLHIGTHPPGLVVVSAVLLRAFKADPALGRSVEGLAPASVGLAQRVYNLDNPMTPAERATVIFTGALTLLACALTVVPLYLLARVGLPAPFAWAAAALWPLAPSALLFQPTADTAFPLLSTTVLALAAFTARSDPARGLISAGTVGVLLGLGMQLTLAFLAVGLIVAVTCAPGPGRGVKVSAGLVLSTGLGFLAVTGLVWALTCANPFMTWWWNQANHSRFYVEYPRTYLAWVVANPVELAAGIGLPSALWGLTGLLWPKSVPKVSATTLLVLLALTLSGRNLSEVGRLWLPFMPALLPACGFAMNRLGAGPKTLAVTVGLVGLEALALQGMIQVVYPV